jgi:hypothetical protein
LEAAKVDDQPGETMSLLLTKLGHLAKHCRGPGFWMTTDSSYSMHELDEQVAAEAQHAAHHHAPG